VDLDGNYIEDGNPTRVTYHE